MHEHVDELAHFCENWICRKDQCQCQTGQCIDLHWVCDGEWDYADASDEEAIFLIKTWSFHNAQLLSRLNHSLDLCNKRYSQGPFSTICNISFEFGCYLSNVSNPLEINTYRPCINLTQIGDGKEDCYNAYDERNIFQMPERLISSMWGFYLRCSRFAKIPFLIVQKFSVRIIEIQLEHVLLLKMSFVWETMNAKRMYDAMGKQIVFMEKINIGVLKAHIAINFLIARTNYKFMLRKFQLNPFHHFQSIPMNSCYQLQFFTGTILIFLIESSTNVIEV